MLSATTMRTFVGHILSAEGVSTDPEKVSTVKSCGNPNVVLLEEAELAGMSMEKQTANIFLI